MTLGDLELLYGQFCGSSHGLADLAGNNSYKQQFNFHQFSCTVLIFIFNISSKKYLQKCISGS